MFDSQSPDQSQRPPKAVPVSHLAREAKWAIDTPRSYLVPVLLWFTSGQGRFNIDGEMHGYTAHNAIFLPANTAHACEACGRTQGTALFLGPRADLPVPAQTVHLRLTSLMQQTEMNDLVEGFRRDCAAGGPFATESLYHRAALIGLCLSRQMLRLGLNPALPKSTAQPDFGTLRRSADHGS